MTSDILGFPEIEFSTLPNGLRIGTAWHNVMPKAFVGLYTRTGPAFGSIWGLEHLGEHLLFKRTKNRTEYEIAAQIENEGGRINASTDHEELILNATMPSEYIHIPISLFAEMVRDAAFKPEEFEREKEVVIEEIKRNMDSPWDYVESLASDKSFDGQNFGRSPLGNIESVEKMVRDQIYDDLKKKFCGKNMVLVVVGPVEHQKIHDFAACAFGDFPPGERQEYGTATFTSGSKRQEHAQEQIHIAFTFPGVRYGDADLRKAEIMMRILADGFTSPLFHNARSNGLLYQQEAEHAAFVAAGYFRIQAGIDCKRVSKYVEIVGEELCRLKNSIPEEACRRGVKQNLDALDDMIESRESLGNYIGSYLLAQRDGPLVLPSLERRRASCEDVTIEDIMDMAKSRFSQPLCEVVRGPKKYLKNMPTYEEIGEILRGERRKTIPGWKLAA